MSELHRIPQARKDEPHADVIFVHGLGGHPFETWQHGRTQEDSWPYWLADEVPEVQVHCLEYEAAPAKWLGPSLPLVERAGNILAVLLGKGIGRRPIIFVCHSLGGLVIKQMLRKTQDESLKDWRRLAGQIKAVVFLGTPHRGANLADSLFRLGKYLGASPSASDLRTHNGLLTDLNDWFAGHAADLGVASYCFYETRPSAIGMIVPQDSGDIGVPGIARYAVDADHGAICKPEGRDDYRCGFVALTVRECLKHRLEPELERAGVAPQHLPADLPDFQGREDQITQLKAVLTGGSVAVAAVVGMGGVGKSAFALHVAYRLGDAAPDGRILVDMGGMSPQPLTPFAAMAKVIQALLPSAQVPTELHLAQSLYRSCLDGRRVLLLLDNARNTEQVAPLLEWRAPSTLIIVTSRRTITGPSVRKIYLEEMKPDEARRLLTSILGDRDATVYELDGLAKRCGCLPLALRVAGTFLDLNRDWTVAEYLDGLADEKTRLAWLRIEDDVRLDVHAVLGFSARKVAEEEPELFERWQMLAVFPQSFDRAASAAVWDEPEAGAHLNLGKLVRRSMALYDEADGRYHLHDLMRDVARSPPAGENEAAARGRVEAAAERHAQHYCKVLAAAEDLYLKGREAVLDGLALFDLEQRNIAAGQAWAAEHIQASDEAARLAADYAGAGANVLHLRLHPHARIGWLEVQLTACRKLGDRKGEGNALGNLGIAYRHLREPRRAIEHHEEQLAIAREIGDRRGEGNALGGLGTAYGELAEPGRAIQYYEQWLAIAREIGDQRSEASALGAEQKYQGFRAIESDYYDLSRELLDFARNDPDHLKERVDQYIRMVAKIREMARDVETGRPASAKKMMT